MKIEKDHAEILSGVRRSKTTGAPVAMLLTNRDWENWTEALPVEEQEQTAAKYKPLNPPRPGHADLAGCLKYNFHEARYILERASARESAARVAAGAMAKLLLVQFGIEVLSHVIAVGEVHAGKAAGWEEIKQTAAKEDILFNCVDAEAERKMQAAVDAVLRTGDTLGGIFEVVAHNVPPGLGTHANWDERLDGLLSQAVMSLQAVKAVEIGTGIDNAVSHGSRVHDQIDYSRDEATFYPPRQSRRGPGGRHQQRRGCCGPRLPEAHLHFAAALAVGGHGDQGAGEGGLRALRRLRGPGCRRGGRSHGGTWCWLAACWRSSAEIRSMKRGATSRATGSRSGRFEHVSYLPSSRRPPYRTSNNTV